jgi:hypothetical protein
MSSFIDKIDKIIGLLEQALESDSALQSQIRTIQTLAWDAPREEPASQECEILRELAYDLEFFVEDAGARREDPAYFGAARAREEIRQALARLRSISNPTDKHRDIR